MTFKELRKLSGMNQTEYAAYFGIPRRTVQNWDLGVRACPSYILALMEYKLRNEKIIK
jgi:DNA-binding transcriptional regulator YiaG